MIPPGMDLPLHQDNQWFWGVNQLSAPDWLLHVMKESELFDDIMIPQAWLEIIEKKRFSFSHLFLGS